MAGLLLVSFGIYVGGCFGGCLRLIVLIAPLLCLWSFDCVGGFCMIACCFVGRIRCLVCVGSLCCWFSWFVFGCRWVL